MLKPKTWNLGWGFLRGAWLRRACLKAALLGVVLQTGGVSIMMSEPARASGPEAVANPDTPVVLLNVKPEQILPHTASHLQPTYKIQVGLSNEVFPVFANQAALQERDERTWGTISVSISNSSDALLQNRISARIPGWSDEEIQYLELKAGSKHTLYFAPTFLPRLFQNREIAAATVVIHVTDRGGHTVFEQTVPIHLRAADDFYWGNGFKFAPFIASWVTPHDPRVELILSQAKEFAPQRRLPGYEEWKDASGQEKATLIQARAIYRAVQTQGVSYVKSSLTFGENTNVSERIRMPRESLRERSANCIDGVVMYASMFENLGMEPVVVLIPGHAYVGVRLASGSDRYLYFDTVLTGRASFDAAVAAAEHGMERTSKSQMTYIRIPDARRAGIFPMPEAANPEIESAGLGQVPQVNRASAKSESAPIPQ